MSAKEDTMPRWMNKWQRPKEHTTHQRITGLNLAALRKEQLKNTS